jgi:Peptidase family M48
MKYYSLIGAFAAWMLLSPKLSAQSLMTIQHSCSFDGVEPEKTLYIDESSKEAKQIVEKIMNVYVLPQNFIIKAANCKNALATTDGTNRYILFSAHFLENFKKEANTKWAAYCVLAHEIGHHLSNHNLGEEDAKKRKLQELQADKFAGGILFNLGATLAEAQAGIQTFSLENDSNTHPNKKARLEAVAQGWVQAKEKNEEREAYTPTQPTPIPAQSQQQNPSKPVDFNAVSTILKEQLYGKWTTGKNIVHIFELSDNKKARLTTTYTIGNTNQTAAYKWDFKGGVFTRSKIFPNGSLCSPEIFSITFVNNDTFVMKPYGRAGEDYTWVRVQ